MKLLVVGLGYVGSPLAAELRERGHEVVGVRRREGAVPAGVQVVRGDVTDDATWQKLSVDFDAALVLLSAGERSEAAYERTYVGGATRIRQALPQARLLWVSSTAVYGGDADVSVNDDTPAAAAAGPAANLLRAEAAVQAGPHLVVRPSGIYGASRTTLLQRLVRAEISADEAQLWTNRIHRDDLVRCLAFCVEQVELSGTLIASDQEPAQLGDMQDWVQAELARRGMKRSGDLGGVPPVATAAASSGAGAEPRLADSRRAGARKSRRISASRLAALGFRWGFPSYRDGYAPLLEALAFEGATPTDIAAQLSSPLAP